MEEVYKFLSENTVQYLATVDENGRPRVRPFMMLAIVDGRFYFAVGSGKSVYKELLNNPWLEISASSPTFDWVRISGRAVFVKDPAFKEKIVEQSDVSGSIYKKGDDPNFEIFYMDEVTAVISDIYGGSPKIFKP